jgi:hypothetical protein
MIGAMGLAALMLVGMSMSPTPLVLLIFTFLLARLTLQIRLLCYVSGLFALEPRLYLHSGAHNLGF